MEEASAACVSVKASWVTGPRASLIKGPLVSNSPEDLDVHQSQTITFLSLFCNLGKNAYCHIHLKKVKTCAKYKRLGLFPIQIFWITLWSESTLFQS